MSDFSSFLTSLFAQPNPNAPITNTGVNDFLNNMMNRDQQVQIQRMQDPIDAYMADNPGVAGQIAGAKANAANSQASQESSKAKSLSDQSLRGTLDLAADFPFLAPATAAGYPHSQSHLDPSTGQWTTTKAQQADIDKYMAQLKAGRQADQLSSLAVGGVDGLQKLLGLQKTMQESQEAQPATVAKAFNSSYDLVKKVPGDVANKVAIDQFNKDPENRKALSAMQTYLVPALQSAQSLKSMIQENGSVPLVGDARSRYEGEADNLTNALISLKRAGGTAKFSKEFLDFVQGMENNPKAWKSTFLKNPDQMLSELDNVQKTLLADAKSLAPPFAQPDYSAIAGKVKNPELKNLILQQDPSNQSSQTATYGQSPSQPPITADGGVHIKYVGPDGTAVENHVSPDSLDKYKAQAKKYGGSLFTGDGKGNWATLANLSDLDPTSNAILNLL